MDIHVWEINRDKVVAKTEEQHLMRFFFPRELELFLEITGFQLLRLGAFPEFDKEPNESTWNITVIAREV